MPNDFTKAEFSGEFESVKAGPGTPAPNRVKNPVRPGTLWRHHVLTSEAIPVPEWSIPIGSAILMVREDRSDTDHHIGFQINDVHGSPFPNAVAEYRYSVVFRAVGVSGIALAASPYDSAYHVAKFRLGAKPVGSADSGSSENIRIERLADHPDTYRAGFGFRTTRVDPLPKWGTDSDFLVHILDDEANLKFRGRGNGVGIDIIEISVRDGLDGLGQPAPEPVKPEPAPIPSPVAPTPGFTPVIGFAAGKVTGGEGKPIVRVTNLKPSGPGSFAEALSGGNRIIIFEAAGVIDMAWEPLRVVGSNTTIAGETAPPPGINLHRTTLTFSPPGRGTLENVICRHLRIRRGGPGPNVQLADAVSFLGLNGGGRMIRNIWLDHCSIAHGADENLQTWYDTIRDISITNCLFMDPLHQPPDGYAYDHGYNLLIGDNNGPIDVQRCLFLNGSMRNPRMNTGSIAMIANNVVYNCSVPISFEYGYNDNPAFAALIGNLVIRGPNSDNLHAAYFWQDFPKGTTIHFVDNAGANKAEAAIRRKGGGEPKNTVKYTMPGDDFPGYVPGTKAIPAEMLCGQVKQNAGAYPKYLTAAGTRIDAVDALAIEQLSQGKGAWTSSPFFPNLATTNRPLSPPDHRDVDAVRAWLGGYLGQVQHD